MLRHPEKLFKLSHQVDYLVEIKKIDFYIKRIKCKNLIFAKINHAFFEFLCFYDQDKFSKLFEASKFWLDIHDIDIITEVRDIISNIDSTNIILGVSNIPYISNFSFGTNQTNFTQDLIAEKIKMVLPRKYLAHSACIWKYFTITKQIHKLYECLNEFEVIVVGMNHLKELEYTLGLSNLLFYKINIDSSRKQNRYKVLDEIYKFYDIKKKQVFIFQAGEMFSAWLIYKLLYDKNIKNCSLIDMGRSLDYYCPNRKLENIDSEKPCLYDFYNQKWIQLHL